MSVAVDWKPYLDRAGEAAKAGRHNEALGVCRDILKADPTNIYAKAISGMVKQMQNNQFEAFSILTDVVKEKADIAVWHAYLSMAARALDKMDESLTAAKLAMALDPSNVEYMINMALVLQDMDNFADAKLYLVKAISANNTHADAHLAMGQLLLTEGDYKAGFEEYDWRKKTGMGLKAKPQISSMPWNGMVLKQAHLLIIGDQGYGDVFQFSRYIREAAKRVGKVIFASSVELFPIMKEMEGVDLCVTKWTDVPGHAFHCLVSDLPRILEARIGNIPGTPWIKADEGLTAQWKERLPEGFKIGLAWTGRTDPPNNKRRSMKLEELLPLRPMTHKGAHFASLQKPVPEYDKLFMPDFKMEDHSALLTDFSQTAAAIANLDLVITIDTGVAHLAGAMGKPVYVMVPKVSDWRWGTTDGNLTPWYPNTIVFHQDTPGIWKPTILAVWEYLKYA
jgi:hypothetical protein